VLISQKQRHVVVDYQIRELLIVVDYVPSLALFSSFSNSFLSCYSDSASLPNISAAKTKTALAKTLFLVASFFGRLFFVTVSVI
jgi:hypothetical protein